MITMKLTTLRSFLFSLTLTSVLCAEEPTKKEPDPFDITAIQKRVEEVGVPTPVSASPTPTPAGTSHSNDAAVDVSGGFYGLSVAPGAQHGGRVGGTGTQITASEPNESK